MWKQNVREEKERIRKDGESERSKGRKKRRRVYAGTQKQ